MNKRFFNYNNQQTKENINEVPETLENVEPIILSDENNIIDEIANEIPTEVSTEEIMPMENQNEESEKQVFEKGIIVNCAALNVRKEPSKESEILTTLKKDTEITILSTDFDGFYKVSTENNIVGYCVKDFVEIK